mgnify:CR=1 FL=1
MRSVPVVVNATTYNLDADGVLTPFPSKADVKTLIQIPGFVLSDVAPPSEEDEDEETEAEDDEKEASTPAIKLVSPVTTEAPADKKAKGNKRG